MSARVPASRESRFQAPQLWCIDLAAAAPALREVEGRTPRLSEGDRDRASSYSDTRVADEWLAAHIALRLLLERAAGPQWRRAAFVRAGAGKPHLDGASVAFSLSHAPGVALIGLTGEGSIGVDIERSRTVRVDAARRARIEEAAAALDAAVDLPSAGEARFLQAWVRLEALAKAEGCGIGRVLTRLGILGSRRGGEPAREGASQAIAALCETAEVRDLAVGEGMFAATAFAGEPATTNVSWLPATMEGLEKLVG